MNIHSLNTIKSESQAGLPETSFYRGYDLISRQSNGKCIGEIFTQDVRVAYCETSISPNSLQHLRDIVDKLVLDKINDRMNAFPSTNEFRSAIRESYKYVPMTIKKLLTHFQTVGRHDFPLEELMLVSDSSNTTEVSLLLAELGRLLCDLVGFEPPTPFDGRDPFLALLVGSTENCPNLEKPVTLTLTTNFAHALNEIERPLT